MVRTKFVNVFVQMMLALLLLGSVSTLSEQVMAHQQSTTASNVPVTAANPIDSSGTNSASSAVSLDSGTKTGTTSTEQASSTTSEQKASSTNPLGEKQDNPESKGLPTTATAPSTQNSDVLNLGELYDDDQGDTQAEEDITEQPGREEANLGDEYDDDMINMGQLYDDDKEGEAAWAGSQEQEKNALNLGEPYDDDKPEPEEQLKCQDKCRVKGGISCKIWKDQGKPASNVITCCKFTGCQWPAFCHESSFIVVEGCENRR